MAAKAQPGDPWFHVQKDLDDIGLIEQHHTWFDAREDAQRRFGMEAVVTMLDSEKTKELEEKKKQDDARRVQLQRDRSSPVCRTRKQARK